VILETSERDFTYRATIFAEPPFLRQLRTQLDRQRH
jgi:hypothetical protein